MELRELLGLIFLLVPCLVLAMVFHWGHRLEMMRELTVMTPPPPVPAEFMRELYGSHMVATEQTERVRQNTDK